MVYFDFIKTNDTIKRSYLDMYKSADIAMPDSDPGGDPGIEDEVVFNFTEDFSVAVLNPERGWYHDAEVVATAANPNNWSVGDAIARTSDSTVRLIQVGLALRRTADFTAAEIERFNSLFGSARNAGVSVIFRFEYDLDGVTYDNYSATNVAEPDGTPMGDPFYYALRHIEQLGPVFEANKDVLFMVQAGTIGPWGEWHTSRWSSEMDAPASMAAEVAIGRKYLEVLPQDVYTVFRRPMYVRNVVNNDPALSLDSELPNSVPPCSADNAFGSQPIARAGFFIDSLFGGDNNNILDDDTYSFPGGGSDQAKRDSDLAWLNEHIRFTPAVGESYNETWASPSLQIDSVVAYLDQTNFTSMSADLGCPARAGTSGVNNWKGSKVFSENGAESDYDFITRKLGYRFVLQEVAVSGSVEQGGSFGLRLKVQNKGFGNLLKSKRFEVALRQGSIVHKAPIDEDVRFWDKRDGVISRTYNFSVPSDLLVGQWQVFLGITPAYESLRGNASSVSEGRIDHYSVRFSNTMNGFSIWDSNVSSPTLGFNEVGSLIVSPGSGANTTFEQVSI